MHRLAIPLSFGVENIACRNQRLQHFFDEKGVAFGQAIDGVQKLHPHWSLLFKNGPQLFAEDALSLRCIRCLTRNNSLFEAVAIQPKKAYTENC